MKEQDYSNITVRPGRAYPLGATVREGGTRFAIASRHATRVWLAFFENEEDKTPIRELEFDSRQYRTGDVFSIFVKGVWPGSLYAFRLDGPLDPIAGHRFDPDKYILDPYAKLIIGDIQRGTGKCVVVDENEDWSDDIKPLIPMNDTIIYETHVRGLSFHESSNSDHPGTYLGIIDKIPYLKDLGITAIELLPIQECGEVSLGRCSIITSEELTNYWGYNSIGFFAPAAKYAWEHGKQIDEFRKMVAALHKAGLEIILDVVFNHTAEGNEKGPTLCFRGIANSIFYMLDENGKYNNFSGCGNTMNCNHPMVRNFILDCLRYWVTVMHVDGFRFDLASILGRDQNGKIHENAPLIEHIAEDPIMRDVKLIAEAWDAGGAYQVGSFGDVRWAEWNGRYRDDARRFWHGNDNVKGEFATRLTGSSDLYEWCGRDPRHSINFITAHDGFTLRDLVSYNEKHNEANGENNCDGSNDNISWNCGVEGETEDPDINALRMRMQKNYLATMFLSLGVPMLCGGDEFGRTQNGNNNAYCQDNEISWYIWSFLEKNRELHRFCKEIIQFRKTNPVLTRRIHFRGESLVPEEDPDILWFDEHARPQDWDNANSSLACWINPSQNASIGIYMMFNHSNKKVKFKVTKKGSWRIRINTSEKSPQDIVNTQQSVPLKGKKYLTLQPKSIIVLTAATRVRH